MYEDRHTTFPLYLNIKCTFEIPLFLIEELKLIFLEYFDRFI